MNSTSPTETTKPRLAEGCRWSTHNAEPVLLFPEGMIRLKGTALGIMELCDGQRTIHEIISTLVRRYEEADPARIAEDTYQFLGSLQQKRIVNFV